MAQNQNDPIFTAISTVVDKLVDEVRATRQSWNDGYYSASFSSVVTDTQQTGVGVVFTVSARPGGFSVLPLNDGSDHEFVLSTEQWKDKLYITFEEIGMGPDDGVARDGEVTLGTQIKDVLCIDDREVVFEFNADDISLSQQVVG